MTDSTDDSPLPIAHLQRNGRYRHQWHPQGKDRGLNLVCAKPIPHLVPDLSRMRQYICRGQNALLEYLKKIHCLVNKDEAVIKNTNQDYIQYAI